MQIRPQKPAALSLDEMANKLSESGKVTQNAFLLRVSLTDPDYEITLFKDGRAIIKGTDEPALARAIYSRYIGL